jgi:hypothetical protein
MFRITGIILISILLLPAITPIALPFAIPDLPLPLWRTPEAWAQADKTDLMQQSDHKRRAANQAKAEPVRQQAAGVIPIEANSGDGDYLVLAILVGSILILAFLASRRKKIRFKPRSRTR